MHSYIQSVSFYRRKPVLSSVSAHGNQLSKTAHNKIFVGRPSFTEFDVLYEKLKDLYTAAHNEDAAKTKELLMEIVPTYKPVNNK